MKKRGFTLIELLVVVAIIGLLSSIVLVSIKTAREDAAEKKSMQFSASIYHSLGAYALGIWHFDGDYNDSSGNDIYTEWDSPGDFVDGIINQAVNLDTSGDTMSIPSSEKLKNKSGQATIEFWLKVNSSITTGGVVHAQDMIHWTEPVRCSLFSSQRFRCYLEDVEVHFVGFEKNYQVGKWFHIVLTYDGNQTAQMFFNGEEVPRYSGGTLYDELSTEAYFSIGDIWGAGGPNAYIDEFRIYDSYINISEVQKHYVNGLIKIGLGEYYNRIKKS
jgi:prepilin-type N-terminal cleavage/methylation domain-containing protein